MVLLQLYVHSCKISIGQHALRIPVSMTRRWYSSDMEFFPARYKQTDHDQIPPYRVQKYVSD